MKNKAIEQQRNEMAQALLDLIKLNDDVQWQAGWFSSGFNGAQVNAISGVEYKGNNLFATYLTSLAKGYKDNRWLTFNQAQELGGNIKKGEKGLGLLKWIDYDKKTKKAPKWSEILALPLEEQRAYIKENIIKCANRFVVFNVEQCENLTKLKPLEEYKMTDDELKVHNAKIEKIIANSEAPIYYDGGDSAFYRPASDDIHLPAVEKFKTKQDYYSTALHEIAHSTGHETRLNRNLKNTFGSFEYAKEELRAEISSVFTQSELGLQVNGKVLENHGAYVKGWAEDLTEKDVLKMIDEAKQITDYVKTKYLKVPKKENVVLNPLKGFKGAMPEKGE